MPQLQAKVIRFHKPNNDNATVDHCRTVILEHIARIDQTRRFIYDPITQRPIRPAHIIAACDTLALLCHNMRQVDTYLIHNSYRPLVDDGIQLLASKAMQVLATVDWFGVPVEFVDLMKQSATKIMHQAAERRESYREVG